MLAVPSSGINILSIVNFSLSKLPPSGTHKFTNNIGMEQQRAINALEPYLALSKSATSPRAAADVINQATAAPHTLVFAELLHRPNIHALQSSKEYAKYWTLLEIFAWGTWGDYQCRKLVKQKIFVELIPLQQQHRVCQNSQNNSRRSYACYHSSH